jgi:hypothetical protein
MELIKAFLISNEEINQDAKRNTNTQTESIDERIHFAFSDVSRCYFEIIANHKGLIYSELKFVSEDDAGSEEAERVPNEVSLRFRQTKF